MSEVYEVRDTILTGLPEFNEAGERIGVRGVGEGALLTPEELEGIDIERLLRLGSIAKIEEGAAAAEEELQAETEKPKTREEELGLLTKAQIFDLAIKAGATPDDLKKLKKDELIAVVIAAWDAAVNAETVEEAGGDQ